MAATMRLVLKMTPQEKRDLFKRARRVGLSPWDYVRRQLNTPDECVDNHVEVFSDELG